MLNTYCWIMSTFSVPAKNMIGKGNEYAYAGVQPYIEGKSEKTLHAYYQWVPFVLFLQVTHFYSFFWFQWLPLFWNFVPSLKALTNPIGQMFNKGLQNWTKIKKVRKYSEMKIILTSTTNNSYLYFRASFFICHIGCGKFSRTERCPRLLTAY